MQHIVFFNSTLVSNPAKVHNRAINYATGQSEAVIQYGEKYYYNTDNC
jgi:hypothetical protein